MRAPALYPYASLEAASAAAGCAHRDLDAAEGAHIEGETDRAGALARCGLRELRRVAAHLGYGLVPLEDLPLRAQADAARLIQREEPADWHDEHAARSERRQTQQEHRDDYREER